MFTGGCRGSERQRVFSFAPRKYAQHPTTKDNNNDVTVVDVQIFSSTTTSLRKQDEFLFCCGGARSECAKKRQTPKVCLAAFADDDNERRGRRISSSTTTTTATKRTRATTTDAWTIIIDSCISGKPSVRLCSDEFKQPNRHRRQSDAKDVRPVHGGKGEKESEGRVREETHRSAQKRKVRPVERPRRHVILQIVVF